MTNNVEDLKIECNGKSFTKGTYNGVSVIFNDEDGFINATYMCKQFNKRFAKINENHAWQSYFQAFNEEYYARPKMGGQEKTPMYQLNKGFSVKQNELRGTYVDPRLINYIAIWASPTYAIYVGKIMDSINDKVHEVLNEKQLPDTVENAKPVFVDVAKQIAPSINTEAIENQFWGYRDKVYELDQWEKNDLRRCIDDYKEIKEKLTEQEQKLNKWGRFIDKYFPEFNK